MAVVRAESRPTKKAAEANFTGVVWQDEVLVGKAPSRMRATMVSFTPGARTAWHSHPVGQTLYCVSGVGRLCLKGEAPKVLYPGDTGMIPPNTAALIIYDGKTRYETLLTSDLSKNAAIKIRRKKN